MKNKPLIYIILTFLVIMGLLSVSTTIVRANSPSSITLAYDIPTTTLNATITHTVSNPSSHYIESVTIKVNGSTVKTETYDSQPTASTFMYQYNISANINDTITVRAVCNISGQLERSLTLEDSGNGTTENKIPGFALIGVISATSVILLGTFTFKKVQRRK